MNILKMTDQGRALIVCYQADRTDGVDQQGDMAGPDDLWYGSAHWASGFRTLKLQHDPDHDLPPAVLYCESSFVTGDKSYKTADYVIPAKTWAVWLKFGLDTADGRRLWADLKDKKLQGLSIGGSATTEPYAEEML